MQSCTRVELTRTCRRAAWKRKFTRSRPQSCEQTASEVEWDTGCGWLQPLLLLLLMLERSYLTIRREVRASEFYCTSPYFSSTSNKEHVDRKQGPEGGVTACPSRFDRDSDSTVYRLR